jgi:phenylalanyl-tRNA synthetase beta subunit
MKFNYKKLQSHIVEPLPAVDVLREKIIFHAFEVESVDDLGDGDYELEIKVLPDRAFDAKEDRGMAREIAALFKLNLIEPDHYNRSDKFDFTAEQVSKLLGRTITNEEIEAVFDAYNYQYTYSESSGFLWTLFIPPWRKDLHTIHDICDEIGRYLGYDSIPAILPNLKKNPLLAEEGAGGGGEYVVILAKKQELIAQGYHEVMTYSLTKKGDYQVAKGPKGKDFLRTNLLDGMRIAYAVNKQNEELLPNATAKIFEIGKVFPKTGEELHVAWIDAKGEHEEVLSAEHSSPFQEEVVGGRRSLEEGGIPKRFHMWSEYPYITRDLAFWTPNLEHEAFPHEVHSLISRTVIERVGNLFNVQKISLFDKFVKNNKVSFAFRLIFQSYDRTLTNEEVDAIMATIYAKVVEKGWEVR